MKIERRGDSLSRHGLVLAAAASLWGAGVAEAAPVFSATVDVGQHSVGLGWSSDLGPDVFVDVGPFPGTGAPVTASAVATRDGRTISASITQVSPYVLADQFWAASWRASADIPGPGIYGLFASLHSSSTWNFAIPGQTVAQNRLTRFYWASQWEVLAPADIHPDYNFNGGVAEPLMGSDSGSFTLQDWYSFGIPGFLTRHELGAATFSGDSNRPGHMDFSYQIAFSTTPIDSSVFIPLAVPEPAPWALMLIGLVGMLARSSTGSKFLRPAST